MFEPEGPDLTQQNHNPKENLTMKRGEVFQSNYLKKEDVPSPVVLTIDHVTLKEIEGDDGKEKKAVMFWREDGHKPMIVNNTNWMTCEDLYGDDSDGWSGKRVEVFMDNTIMFGGKRVGGVRVRKPNSNGDASVWTWEQALTECAKVGLDKDYVIGHLKAEGKTAWNNHRDTASIQALVRKHQPAQETSFDAPPTPKQEEDIPF